MTAFYVRTADCHLFSQFLSCKNLYVIELSKAICFFSFYLSLLLTFNSHSIFIWPAFCENSLKSLVEAFFRALLV